MPATRTLRPCVAYCLPSAGFVHRQIVLTCPSANARLRYKLPVQPPRLQSAVLLAVIPVMSSCSTHLATPASPGGARPHLSWEIRTGGDDGDARLACGSSQRPPVCSLEASSDEHPTFTTVRLFLHAAARQTSYLGFLRVPFVQGAGTASREINATVPPDSSPVGASVHGLITREPGTYTMSIAIDVLQEGWTVPERIAQEIPVTVR
jgi:hypothetical protein